MKTNLFDIVIPVGPNDLNVINEQIKYTKKMSLDIEIYIW